MFRSDRKAQRTPTNFVSAGAASTHRASGAGRRSTRCRRRYWHGSSARIGCTWRWRPRPSAPALPRRWRCCPPRAVHRFLKGLTGRSLKRVRLLPSRQQRTAGYGANGNNALEWAGDAAAPGMEQVTQPNGTTAGASPAPKQGMGAADRLPCRPGGRYNDGYGAPPAPARDQGTTSQHPTWAERCRANERRTVHIYGTLNGAVRCRTRPSQMTNAV